jgi:small subunit ribosomal protein S3e
MRIIMAAGARGCEIIVAGKLRGKRARSMKFVAGSIVHSGNRINDFVDTACKHVTLLNGAMGIK